MKKQTKVDLLLPMGLLFNWRWYWDILLCLLLVRFRNIKYYFENLEILIKIF